ncbi:hypothetical protein AB1Y20_004546 [Prymnesium parvum]|uniref:Receptor ligand binding region domain-containing protein n=1 Tax=Prymnesium parvum TaxID=97485 RepID=A0AB34IZK8_PRYPA
MHIALFTCITWAWFTAAASVTADASMPPGRAGYAVTFDGRGTDIATAQLAPEIFLGARGLTISLWCRAFGFSAYPTESVVLSMLTPSEAQWLVPIRWRAHGAALDHIVFGTSTYEAASAHMDAFEQWRHFTFTWNAESGALRAYVDGQLASEATNVKQGYNVTAGAADGVLLALGVHALGPTSHAPTHSFRGSIDHLQLWTVHLNAEQVAADYRTLGESPVLPTPALRYTFDEGPSDVAANTGALEGADLHLGRNPDGVRYFTSGDATAWQYTSPVWAPSSIPVLESTAARLAPIVVSFKPGINEKITLTTSAAPCQISHLPSHGQLLFNEHVLSLEGLVPSGAVLTFASTSNETALSTSFKLECADSSSPNVAVHLLLEVAPQVVLMPTQCSWPLGVLECTSLHLSTIVPKDSPTIIFLIGRSFHGSDRTSAVVLAAPRTGFLYQLDSCCDPVTGRGGIIRDGDPVLHGSSGVVYVPERDAPDDRTNLTFLVLDSRGAKSAPATMSIEIRRVIRRVDDVPVVENMSRSSAKTPIDVPLRVRDADALTAQPRLTTVRLGVLLPMFGTQVVGYNQELWSPRLGVYQALREINNKSDGVADELLPNTNLVFAYRDSKCDATVAISGSLQLISSAFDGQGVSAIIGGGCSSASVAATQVSDATFGIPIISPSSTSPDLSDGTLYRSFLRTCPSDSFQIEAIFELFQLLFNYSGAAGLVTSSDSYGTGFSTAFRAIARNKGLSTLTDDDGSYIWAQDHDANASTPLACAGVDPSAGVLAYEPYAYDATFALAYALHHLIEVQNRSEVVGSELIDALIKHVQFEGASGLVDFFDASDEPTRWYHGDRRVGTAYSLMNYADNAQGLVEVGSWTPCQAAPCDWSERWHPIQGVGLRFSTSDNSRPPLYAPPRVTTVRLGVLLPMFGTQAVGYSRVLWSPRLGVYQALREINDKSDGVADELLPNTKLVFAYRDSKCDETHSISAGLQLTQDVFGGAGVNAIIGAGCRREIV